MAYDPKHTGTQGEERCAGVQEHEERIGSGEGGKGDDRRGEHGHV